MIKTRKERLSPLGPCLQPLVMVDLMVLSASGRKNGGKGRRPEGS
jgi:hypothetical protein